MLPPTFPEWLGGSNFQQTHGTRFAYAAGSMANGIATPELVESLAHHGMLGFFGAAGLPFERVEAGVAKIASHLSGRGLPWGANLIHSPHEPALEIQSAKLFLERGVPCVEASAYMTLTPAVVLAGVKGIATRPDGSIARPRALFVKLSRPEVAQRFLSPPPSSLLNDLADQGLLTQDEVHLAKRLPLATDVTVEADSGGHTDNRPLAALLPTIKVLWEEIRSRHQLDSRLRIGAAGGIGTPSAVAAAFALGADYVVTGSLNQGAVESGLSADGKAMLARAELADVAMAAAADMFELGVKVQVLRRGTLFAARANRLYELYRSYDSIEALPDEVRKELEEIFRSSLDGIWEETQAYWLRREPEQAARALYEPHHKMALIFRWYLGMASRWAINGDESRRGDYQIWCGPAMGAFNAWTKGSFLESPGERTVVQIGLNLLEGAAVTSRAQQLRACGVDVPSEAFCYRPRRLGVG
ncbi:MAG TPA: PfaD family polyunsaturated fatty acid/polyketide biosynthesis protein [Bryobacteraceae bacterium]|nr:PfaD family polyunsaturated fatty acid/polyketide biosynthesis protein [Bryobacteraceae bacterium]